MDKSNYSASDSYLGYVFQGLYALIMLLDADDEETVSIETQDDIVLNGTCTNLIQLKHNYDSVPTLTLANVGLWKTIRIWAESPRISSTRFTFVTCARIQNNGVLLNLTPDSRKDLDLVVLEFTKEAKRVIDERESKKNDNIKNRKDPFDKLPHQERSVGCERFYNLPDSIKKELIERLIIKPETFNVTQIAEQLSTRLKSYVIPKIRDKVVERLIEWWDRRVILSLTNEQPRVIHKEELQWKLQDLISELRDDSLPDDFSMVEPPSLDSELGTTMEKQIALVNGGKSRLLRAARVRWLARNQREKWMSDDISISSDLAKFDKGLLQAWRDRFEPIKEDCCSYPDPEQCKKGLELLDWSHNEAPHKVIQPREKWRMPFLTQGTYQQLADEGKVGWHPQFRERLFSEVE